MADPTFGLVFRTTDNEPRPVVRANLSTVGLIGPASEADAAIFPINTPVKLYSYDKVKIAALGDSEFLADAIRGIHDQLGERQIAAEIVVIRTALGTDADEAIKLQQTIANIMGDSSAGTGLWAFLKAPDDVQVTPRLIIAPGYTGLLSNGVDAVTVGTTGEGYVAGATYTVTFSGGGDDAVQATGHAVADEDGEIGTADIVIDSPGMFYETPPTVAIQASPTVGSGGVTALATATIDQLANPIVAGAGGLLAQLMAHAIFESSGSSQNADEQWRETINSRRIIPLSGGCKVVDPDTGAVVVRPLAPRIAGIAVRRDHETGAPFHSWANQPIYGIVGAARRIPFSLLDSANEGQSLLSSNIGIVVRGEIGSDRAISTGGFIFIGTDNAGDSELWRFYNVTRGRDFIHVSLIPPLREFLGRFNIVPHTIEAVLQTVDYFLRDLKADDHIIGYKVYFEPDQNSPEEIRLGHLTIGFAAEEPPPLRKITTESGRDRAAIDQMVQDVAAQLQLAA